VKICRVSNSYPHENNPGSGLTPYYLSKCIYHPTLYITKAIEVEKKKVPKHVVLKEISYRDEATPQALRDELHSDEKSHIGRRILRLLKVIKTFRSVTFFLKSIPALAAFRPEIVACHQNLTVFHGVFAKYCLGSKFILHIHNNSEIEVIRNLWLLRWLVQRADLIFCLSEIMSKELKKIIPSIAGKIRHTSTGMNPRLFKNVGLKRKDQLIAIGSFKWTKGYKYLLDAVARVFRRYPEYSLVIVGDGNERESITRQIQNLEISNKVELKGIVSRQDVMKLLNESRLFVMSSIHEGLAKVLLEALSCGTPAVITTGCYADNLVQGRGLLVETRNSQALAKAIIKLIDDKEFWQRCSMEASNVRKEYNWENVAQRVYHDYSELLHNGR